MVRAAHQWLFPWAVSSIQKKIQKRLEQRRTYLTRYEQRHAARVNAFIEQGFNAREAEEQARLLDHPENPPAKNKPREDTGASSSKPKKQFPSEPSKHDRWARFRRRKKS
ncbi:MAG: hypothetical protein AABY11_01245 [archaeon]